MPTSGRLTFVALKGKNLNVQDSDMGGKYCTAYFGLQLSRSFKAAAFNIQRFETSGAATK